MWTHLLSTRSVLLPVTQEQPSQLCSFQQAKQKKLRLTNQDNDDVAAALCPDLVNPARCVQERLPVWHMQHVQFVSTSINLS